jgi:hypothetical protein
MTPTTDLSTDHARGERIRNDDVALLYFVIPLPQKVDLIIVLPRIMIRRGNFYAGILAIRGGRLDIVWFSDGFFACIKYTFGILFCIWRLIYSQIWTFFNGFEAWHFISQQLTFFLTNPLPFLIRKSVFWKWGECVFGQEGLDLLAARIGRHRGHIREQIRLAVVTIYSTLTVVSFAHSPAKMTQKGPHQAEEEVLWYCYCFITIVFWGSREV